MSAHRPVGVDQLDRFDAIIDARSPAEFAEDHLPGAINCPVLDDEERRIVGTLYATQGAFVARRIGGAMVAANLSRHLRTQFSGMPERWRPLVYCWRGGMRSGSMTTWMRMVGWDAQQLAGGYKSFRRHVIARLDALAPTLDLRVVCGPTGSAKSRLLRLLADEGAQVLDLEALAVHKGSVLGQVPGQGQPTQKAFETRLWQALEPLDAARPVFVEAESRRIGRVQLPTVLLERMRQSRCIELQAPVAARLAYLLQDYAYLGDDRAALVRQLGLLRGLHANTTIDQWQAWAQAGELAPLFEALMVQHYDPAYARSQRGDFLRLAEAEQHPLASLDDAALRVLAKQLSAR
ncbi:MAG: tRNA 2-selenouridine(34) synthase MnmH [Burkholderiales bacterium]|nr:tRNA 2-selenouridine(34) synthase MnmH [Burkholderiales bacterium]